MTDYGELKCGTCRHWFQEDAVATGNLDPGRGGTCRESPPVIVPVGIAQTPQGLAFQGRPMFPSFTPQSIACSKHEAREVKSPILV